MGNIVSVLKDSPEGKAIIAEQTKASVAQNIDKPNSEPVNDHVETQSKIDPPFSIYEKEKGTPYTAEYFKLPAWELAEKKIKVIEKWIKNKIEKNNLEDTLDSYRYFIDRYFDELNIGKTEKGGSKLDRVYNYINLLDKQEKLDNRRREILNGSRK